MKEQGRDYNDKMKLWKYVGIVMLIIVLALLITYLFTACNKTDYCNIDLPDTLTYQNVTGELCFFETGTFGSMETYWKLAIVPTQYDWDQNLYYTGDDFITIPIDKWGTEYGPKDALRMYEIYYKYVVKAEDTCQLKAMIEGQFLWLIDKDNHGWWVTEFDTLHIFSVKEGGHMSYEEGLRDDSKAVQEALDAVALYDYPAWSDKGDWIIPDTIITKEDFVSMDTLKLE